MESKRPEWRIPENLQSLIEADDDLSWETSDWSPILLSVISGTSYGRDIPLAWQIEFEPIGSTGYDWSDRIAHAVDEQYPELVDHLHFDDTELSTCVVWVESEAVCRRLIDVVWTLIHDE